MGLRESIKNAQSESEVLSLLSSGTKYKFASERTKRSWKSTARYRISQMSNPIPVQEPKIKESTLRVDKIGTNKKKKK